MTRPTRSTDRIETSIGQSQSMQREPNRVGSWLGFEGN